MSVAGSDPTGGAGIQGDLKTFAAHGVYGTAVVAAITAQNARGVLAVERVDPETVVRQLDALFDQAPPDALKTGMLLDPEVVEAVADTLRRRGAGPLVVDPVLWATAGGSLARDALPRVLIDRLFPLAALVTPNGPEAEAFLGRPLCEDPRRDAEAFLRETGCRAVLLKGGHRPSVPGAGGVSVALDVLATRERTVGFGLPRIETGHGHGAGCALSASIACRLARGDSLETAVRGAKAYVHRALGASVPLGNGRGPVRHDVPADDAPAEGPAPRLVQPVDPT